MKSFRLCRTLSKCPTARFDIYRSILGETRCEFLRFDNIDEGPDPKDLELTWLPDDEDLVSVPMTAEPWASAGYSFCQEPGLVLLPDGRLFTEMRTANGDIWYTVSDDDGHTWRETEVLRYRDGGDRMLNPELVAANPVEPSADPIG